jgi:APA family basic amino acid/polyamine antiporter
MLAAGIAFGGDFSTLNSSIAVPPRYLFTMARDGAMPKVFAKLHPKFKTPYVAILTLGVLTIVLTTTNSIIYIASLSLFADLFYYVIGIIACVALRKRMPELKRPYKAPAAAIGAVISAVIYIVMMTQLDSEAFWTGIIWCVLGLIIFFICQAKYGKAGDEDLAEMIVDHADPSAEEKAKMDKEFKIWAIVVAIAVVVALLLYIVPFVMA